MILYSNVLNLINLYMKNGMSVIRTEGGMFGSMLQVSHFGLVCRFSSEQTEFCRLDEKSDI